MTLCQKNLSTGCDNLTKKVLVILLTVFVVVFVLISEEAPGTNYWSCGVKLNCHRALSHNR